MNPINQDKQRELIRSYRLGVLIKSYIITAITAIVVAGTLLAGTDAYAVSHSRYRHNLPRHTHNHVRHPERYKSYQSVRKLHARINKLKQSRRTH